MTDTAAVEAVTRAIRSATDELDRSAPREDESYEDWIDRSNIVIARAAMAADPRVKAASDYIVTFGIGAGDDPVGFLIASHAAGRGQVAKLREALERIASMDPMASIPGSGYVVGTMQTLKNCQREASAALAETAGDE